MCTGKARRHRIHRSGCQSQGDGDQPYKSFQGPQSFSLYDPGWGEPLKAVLGPASGFLWPEWGGGGVSARTDCEPLPASRRRPGANTLRLKSRPLSRSVEVGPGHQVTHSDTASLKAKPHISAQDFQSRFRPAATQQAPDCPPQRLPSPGPFGEKPARQGPSADPSTRASRGPGCPPGTRLKTVREKDKTTHVTSSSLRSSLNVTSIIISEH